MKRLLTFALVFTLVVTMCFGSVGAATAYAADNGQTLSVYDGDELVKQYTLDDLKAIAKKEGDIQYKFSGYNRNPSFYTFGDENAYNDVKKVYGPTVAGLLADAGVSYTDDQLISFQAADGLVESFIAGDFFKERYYFPNGKIAVPYKGTVPCEENYAGAQTVVPVIDLHRSDDWETVLRFGQTAPNEQNNAAFIKYIADGGSIIVGDVQTEAWESITSANYNSGEILPETELEFNIPTKMIGKKVAVYFTTDGTEPYHGDAIYNYDKYGSVQEIVLPEDECTVTYKFKAVGYGKLDSEVTTFTYEVKEVAQPDKPSGFTVAAASDGIRYEWEPAEGADIYEILKYNPDSEKYELFQHVDGSANMYTYSAVKAGETYNFKIRSVKELSSGQKVYSSAAQAVAVTVPEQGTQAGTPGIEAEAPTEPESSENPSEPVKPENPGEPVKPENPEDYVTPDDPTVNPEDPSDTEEPADEPEQLIVGKPVLESAVKTGYGGIRIKWSRVEDADGYQIWRYDKVSKKYKLVKTITQGSTVSWKNTGLKTGRKYTYKVRAYVNFNSQKVFSKYSGTKVATPTLNQPVITKLTAGKKSVTVRWKQVPGANGYKIYRSTAKNGKYTCVKTIKKGKTLSWKNTKLKKGKRYYYKVKAYRIVDKKYVYSSISLSKYKKSK